MKPAPKTKRPPPAFGFGWGVPWLFAVLGALVLWAGIAPAVGVYVGGAVLFLLVPLFVPRAEDSSAARTWQLSSLMLALFSLGGALALKHDAPLEALRLGLRATLALLYST